MEAGRSDDESGDEGFSVGGKSGGQIACMAGCCFCVALGLILAFSFRTVPSGHVGVVSTFGAVNEQTLEPGMSLVGPFSLVNAMSTKTTLIDQQNNVPTVEGLLVELDVSLLYRIDPAKAYYIWVNLGPEFQKVIEAHLASQIRGFTSQRNASALYTSGRDEIQTQLKDAMTEALEPEGIIVQEVLLKAVELPSEVQKSIERKAQEEQKAELMKYTLLREDQEAERKRKEAQGIADFQRIVSEGISTQLLQWKGIEATEKFSESPNSKLVIMGNSHASLPVMMSGDVGNAV